MSETIETPTPVRTRVDVPEPLGYRIKRRLLGPPLVSGGLDHQQLSKTVALGVLSPDCISSSAYGSEEILRILIPVFGAAAFSVLIPMTGVVLTVLLLVTLSYRDVVMAYTKIGGSYAVCRDNFGINVAQVAAVALLIDYIVTVAVQTAAGTDAVLSIFHLELHTTSLDAYRLWITVGVVILLFFGNLRGIKEAGRIFALPTYLFAFSIGSMILVGVGRELFGSLPQANITASGAVGLGPSGVGLMSVASVFYLLRAFANGGSSLTGLEAISDAVPAFKEPKGRNARRTLVIMASILAFLVAGVSLMARLTHAVPFVSGTPTVIAQEAKLILGNSVPGQIGFIIIQLATALILFTGANTSFNGFPFLASYIAGDSFLPRWLTHRGHRLVFSNGIVLLFCASTALLLATGANVDRLVAVYAIGVFTSFAMTGAGMVKFHITHGSGLGIKIVNAVSGSISALVVVIFAVTKFTQGAWVVVVLFPVMVYGLIRTRRRYLEEDAQIDGGSVGGKQGTYAHHTVIVLVNGLDLPVIRALRYARTLRPTSVRAVHFAIDDWHAESVRTRWAEHPAADIDLEVIECPDRRLARAATELAFIAAQAPSTEVTVLLPRRTHRGLTGRLFHDRTADQISASVMQLPGVSATIVPFHPGTATVGVPDAPPPFTPTPAAPALPREKRTAIDPAPRTVAEATWRDRGVFEGRIAAITYPTNGDFATLRATLVDDTGGIELLFYGRKEIAGIITGASVRVEGRVGSHEGRLAIANPIYELISAPLPSGH